VAHAERHRTRWAFRTLTTPPIITLTTDFGTADTFVGQMKGVILGIAPHARIVDITHQVPAHNVVAGTVTLESMLGAFPADAIHVAVVDPGVGTPRLAIAMRTNGGIFVGPDNGLFSAVLQRTHLRECVSLTDPTFLRRRVGDTFHGRDVFAPAAAHLAQGVDLARLGPKVDEPVTLEVPEAQKRNDRLHGCVLASDGFGNLVTSVRTGMLPPDEAHRRRLEIETGNVRILGVARTFADVEPGRPVAYPGSGGRLEIGIRNGNAAAELIIEPAAEVVVHGL